MNLLTEKEYKNVQKNNQNVDYLNPWGAKTENKQETAEKQNNKNGKFNFDPEIFRTAFGI